MALDGTYQGIAVGDLNQILMGLELSRPDFVVVAHAIVRGKVPKIGGKK
jgi:hypothetical protein